MRTARNASRAIILFLVVFWAIVPLFAGAQAPAGRLVVSTDYELFGVSDLRGGGHVTWTLSGEEASDLRRKILNLFDSYPTVPRGFSSERTSTNGNRDGRLDAAEGAVYTNLLETAMEAGSRGTAAHYLQLFPFDLLEKAGDDAASFVRSTSGLAGTDANATGNVEIRFLFQANSTTADARVPLAARVLVDSLYNPFSYRAEQSADLSQLPPYPGPWPFLLEGGWHVVPAFDGRPAFWPGNDSTGMYDNKVISAARTTADPARSPILPIYEPFDLRYASRAVATFNYTGAVASGDALRLQYAHPPAYMDWTNLSFSTGANLPNSPGAWRRETVDLTSRLGEQIRLRLNFTSNATSVGSGFFIRDFAVDAPASYVGEVVESGTHYLIGTLSFSDPDAAASSLHVIRTPGGELLLYGATWSGSPPASDTIRFRTFDVAENPQALFGVMVIASTVISRMQESAFESYRAIQPAEERPALHRTKWLHRSGKVAMALLLLFYFIPTALWTIGVRVFVGGIAYWLLAVGLALLLGLGTRAYYRRRIGQAMPPPPEIPGEETVVRKAVRSTSEAKPIPVDILPEGRHVSLRCEACGEVQALPEGTDPRAATCANCGSRLRRIGAGRRYLVVAGHSAIPFAWLRDLAQGGKPGLCLTSASPERIRLEFGVAEEVPIIQISPSAPGAIDPRQLDPHGLRSILPLAREGKGGVILYDGIDDMIAAATLGEVIRFLRKANDMAFVHGVTVIARLAPGRLTVDEVKRLNAEFDEYLDLSAQP